MGSSERQLEEQLVQKLRDLKYEYRHDIQNRAALEGNFRQKFQALNRVELTDGEFQRLLDDIVTPDVFSAAKNLRSINSFIRDDGTPLNYTLVNTKDWCKNSFEVVNQLRINTDYSHHRYDVLLLINGVPAVQIELKTLGINPRRAMEQIVEYKNDPGNGYSRTLLCFIQLFIISNRDSTYYFANNNARHFVFDANERFLPIYQHAGEDNSKITHLDDFADKFLAKCTLGYMISRYTVLVASEQKLLVMRPYQIYAVKHIVDCIDQDAGNGYVWHTTGSGKTLTSFKASTLLKDKQEIEKCLFVVDRKDLDRQTREEFNRFQEGCVEENTNTESLVRRLLSDDYADKVIVCTIQKLGLALDPSNKRDYVGRLRSLAGKRIVFIFDECHRSQFGDNHKAIKEFFPKAQLFGFTGTPIFQENAGVKQIDGEIATLRTTKDLFQRPLHEYTITHAIEDGNVLRFHVDYYKPDAKLVLKPGERLTKEAVVDAILAKHNAATGGRRFNAILATGSINDAIEYHDIFQNTQDEMLANDPHFVPLSVAAVFSPPSDVSPDVKQIQEDLPQEREDNEQEPEAKKAALRGIIASYNRRFGTSHRLEEFDLYYQDIQKRIKDQQFANADLPKKGLEKIDVTIVVDMLLTGFDSKYLNTLYVDKNLRHHGLIQAFSRTNRVLNATKPYGHILDFRNQQAAVDEAIAMFSGAKAHRAREIWLVDRAPKVIQMLKAAVRDLSTFMNSQGLEAQPQAVPNLKGDEARVGFIERFKEVQRLQTQLDQYTDLTEDEEQAIEQVLPKEQLRAFRGHYLETAQRLREQREKAGVDAQRATSHNLDQLDFEFVLFASALIDYDYIMRVLARFTRQDPQKQTMSREQLIALIESDAKFLDERQAITDYIRSLEPGKALDEAALREGYQRFRADRDSHQVAETAEKHGLTPAALQAFVDRILQPPMIFNAEHLNDLLASLELGWRARTEKELALMADLVPLLKRRAGGREISGLSAYDR
jgi:type I restriction enzyme, R subunit